MKTKLVVLGVIFASLATVTGLYKLAFATGGVASSVYPDNTNSSRTSWMITELCSFNTAKCMRGQTSVVNVYVPQALAGQTFGVTIIDGCDGTNVDEPGGYSSNSFVASTVFDMYYGSKFIAKRASSDFYDNKGTATSADDVGCPDTAARNKITDLNMSFTAESGAKVESGYLVYTFIARGIPKGPDGNSWYMNHYRLKATDGRVKIGITGDPITCDTVKYPKSCPTTGLAYSSISAFNRSHNQWDQDVEFALNCDLSSRTGSIIVYDADHLIYQNNMRLIINEYDRTTRNFIGPVTLSNGKTAGGNGLLVDGGNNGVNSYVYVLKPGSFYRININNIGDSNSLQLKIPDNSSQVGASVACPKTPPPPPSEKTLKLSCGGLDTVPSTPEQNQDFILQPSFKNTSSSGGPAASSASGYQMRLSLPEAGINNADVNYSPDPVEPGAVASGNVSAKIGADGAYKVSWTVSGPNITTINCSDTIAIGRRPYLRAYGGDVLAGSGFLNTSGVCAAAASGVRAFNNGQASGFSGSGGQLAVTAGGVVSGFRSAFSGSFAANLPEYSVFSNNSNLVQKTGASVKFGGQFGGNFCAENYWAQRAGAKQLGGSNIDLSTLSSGKYLLSSKNVAVSGTIPNGRQIALFAQGDINLVGPKVGYASGTWNSVSDIPSLFIVVLGNINISSQITSLDGNFVAQNSNNNDGKINTCVDPATNTFYASASNFIASCGNKLTVFGSFIAKHVNFDRLNGTLKLATVNEAFSSNNIAEVFRFPIESYLSGSAITSVRLSGYDSITALPPSL